MGRIRSCQNVLLIGNERALLIDSGYGKINLKSSIVRHHTGFSIVMEICQGQTYFSHILRKNLTNCALDSAYNIWYTIIAGKTLDLRK